MKLAVAGFVVPEGKDEAGEGRSPHITVNDPYLGAIVDAAERVRSARRCSSR